MQKKYIFIFTILLLCIATASLFAETNIVTLDDALVLARKNNLNLKSNAIDLKAAQRDIDTSWNLFLPSISATLSNSGEATYLMEMRPAPTRQALVLGLCFHYLESRGQAAVGIL